MTELLTRALAAAQRRQGEVLPRLRRWVETNSFSANVAGVNAVAEQLVGDFSLAELTLERIAGSGVGDHLVWRTPAWQARPGDRLLLVGHHDTVHPPGAFQEWTVYGDRLRGPGVLDMKGGLVVIHTAVAALSDCQLLADLPLAVVSVGDEEIGSIDSRPFLESFARGAAAALVFEAGRKGDAIITCRKGTGRLQVKVAGKAAHAGNHHDQGINAIRALAKFVDAIEGETDYQRGLTVNVGTIRGGTSANTVAAAAECDIDFRFVAVRDGDDLVGRADRWGREIAARTGARVRIEGGIRRAPLVRSEASLALYRRYAGCAAAAGLGSGESGLIGGGSDANTVSGVGVPAIDGLGPRGDGFHTPQETIEISSLALRSEALLRFLLAWRDDPLRAGGSA